MVMAKVLHVYTSVRTSDLRKQSSIDSNTYACTGLLELYTQTRKVLCMHCFLGLPHG